MANIRLAFLLLCIANATFIKTKYNSPRTLSPEDKGFINDESKITAEFERLRKAKVGINFKCAMDKMKNGFTKFLQYKGVDLIKCGCFRNWNPRVLQIRIENDLVWRNSSLMYPDYFKNTGGVSTHEEDNKTMCQWIKFVSLDLQAHHFDLVELIGNVPEVDLVDAALSEFKKTGLALRNNLNEYYEKLDHAERDTRYPKGKRDLYRYFAGVMVRMYRLACYYADSLQYTIQRELRRTYENGTRFFLSTALNNSMPTWYIDQEQLDMLNIVLRTQGFTQPKDFFFVRKNITNGMGQKVAIPGYKYF